ncbi:hypothetical protein ABFS82_04G016800 [Erythranthe guttata]|nr:PREDICTED: aspartic proteinase CDR1-like [Erythranthe guttata]|eukprot:XP_012836257.1 PREDICTED: aspartic proteinase CDR1-like [Erythranthe guttata]
MSWALCILFFLLQTNALTEIANGIKLQLSHASLVFENNLSHEQRNQRLLSQSYASSLVSRKSKNPNLLIRPQVGIQSPYYYMVKIGIGTFKPEPRYPSFRSYYLYMDSGSDLLWMQCEGCRASGGRCFPQKEPVYPNNRSSSYRPILCNKNNNSLCEPNHCINGSCSYNMSYLDNTFSSGILASENFVFNSDVGRTEVVRNLVFGCGVYNRKTYGNSSNQIAGVMGLGWGSYSIVAQANSITRGIFSYCLPPVDNKNTSNWPITYLRFGGDVIKRPDLKVTPLLRVKDQTVYHLVLQGISINNKRLTSLSDRDFQLRGDGSGGCIIDSGTPFSRLVQPAYTVLIKALKRHFWNRRSSKLNLGGLELCYERRKNEGYKNLPSMTFHFKNADLVVRPESLFLVLDKIGSVKGEYFCLAIIPSDFISVLGSYQQTNQRFVYDTKQNQLLFGPQDCSKDA